MMKISRNQHGSSHIIAFLGIAVIMAIAVIGYRVAQDSATNSSVTTTTTSQVVTVPSTLKSKADIQKANAALDTTSIDSSVNPNQLDSDLNSLL